MTELEPYAANDGHHPRRLVDWAQEAQAAHEIAVRLTVTSFAPTAYRGKPVEAAAAILAGGEVGLSPVAALNAFDIISGRPAPRAITLRAVAQAQGHEFRLVKSTDTECIVEARRRDATDWQSFAWTVQRAAKLGLLNKDQWQKQPQAMLLARATAEAARFIAADALLGIPYAAEELDELEPATTRRITRRKPEAPTTEEPALPDAGVDPVEAARDAVTSGTFAMTSEPPVDEPDDPEETVKKQERLMHKLFRERGINDHADRIQYATEVLGYPVESSKDLSTAERGKIIDALSPNHEPVQEPIIDAFPDEPTGDDPA